MRLRFCIKNRLAGFTLIQVSLILSVVAIILASTLPGRQAGDYNQKSAESVRKLQKIEDATREFIILNGRRPCPADGQYALTDPSSNATNNSQYFGIEAATPTPVPPALPTPCLNGTPAAPLTYTIPSTTINILGGTVPTRTLGLPDDDAFDGWGRHFTYIVDSRATSATSCYNLQKSITHPVGTGAVTIQDTSGIKDYTMYAYISHGATGDGAWPMQGGGGTLNATASQALRVFTGSTDTGMVANAANTTTSSPAWGLSFYQEEKNPATGFDDILYYSPTMKNTCCMSGPNGQSSACSPQQTDFTIYGVNTDDMGGHTIAVGDVNGDGIPDLIIGAPTYPNGTGPGAVYVIFGSETPFPDPLPLNPATLNSYIDGVHGFRIDGVASDLLTGATLAVADINGDGIGDIIIGAPGCLITCPKNCVAATGKVYVVAGRQSWPAGASHTMASVATTTISNVATPDLGPGFGTALAAKDINGDGIADIVIGSSYSNAYVYAVYGNSTISNIPTDVSGTNLNVASNGFIISNAFTSTQAVSGTPIAIGDLNHDGYNDIVIATPNTSTTANVYTIFGQGSNGAWSGVMNSSSPSTLDVSTSFGGKGFIISGIQVSSVAIGDVNGDGKPDLLLASPNVSKADGTTLTGGAGGTGDYPRIYVVNGPRTTNLDLSTQSNASAIIIGWPMAANAVWMSLALGDINGDGIADIVFGEPYGTGTCNNAGYAGIVFGSSLLTGGIVVNAPLLLPSSGTVEGFHVHGVDANDGFGYSVAIGNITGNSTDDMIIGAPMGSYSYSVTSPGAGYQIGTSYIIQGSATGFSPNVSSTTGSYSFKLGTY